MIAISLLSASPPPTNHHYCNSSSSYLFFISSFSILVAYYLCYTCRESWLKNLKQKVHILCIMKRYEHMCAHTYTWRFFIYRLNLIPHRLSHILLFIYTTIGSRGGLFGAGGRFKGGTGKSALVLFYLMNSCVHYEVFEFGVLHLAVMYLYLMSWRISY